MKPYFITSTGTNIGKTYLTKLIIDRCRDLKISINAIKPIISGFDINNYKDSDTGLILRALNKKNIDEVSPWRFKTPISPDAAAKIENTSIDFFELRDFCKKKIKENIINNSYFLIEGVGGTMVPINDKYTVFDLIKSLNIPIILVIGSYLGSISHTLNALENIKNSDIKLDSIVISQSENDDVGENLTVSSLSQYTQDVPIYFINRNEENNNHIIDQILKL